MRSLAALAALALLLPAAAALGPLAPPGPLPSLLGPNRAAPIVVLGDAGFLLPPDESGVRGGSGTALDPYRIEGWSIVSLPFNPTVGNLGYGNLWLPCVLVVNTAAHAVVRDNFIRGNNCHGLWLQNASNVVVERNLVEYNTGHGLLVEGFGPQSLGHVGANVVVRDNVFKGNGFDGARIFPASGVLVEGNQFLANANHGLLARQVQGLRVRGNLADYDADAGFLVQLSSGAVLEGNTARRHPVGFEVGGDAVVLRDSVAVDNGDGLVVASGATGTTVERNLLRGNARGIVLHACAAAVRDNGVYANGVGLRGEAADCAAAGNNFAGNAIGAGSDAALDLAGNWWGSPSGPAPLGTGDPVQGPLLVSPWLQAPNPVAPS